MKLRNLKMKLPCMDQEHNDVHGYQADSSLFITLRLPNLHVMKIFAQALVLTLLIMVLPGLSESLPSNDLLEGALNLKSLPLVLDDLANQGLLTTNNKSLIISNDILINILNNNNNNIVISPTDTKRQSSVPDNTFDFSFTNCFIGEVRGFVDRTLKGDGIVVVQLNRDPSMAFDMPSNHYKMVYFRRFDDTFIAMQKITSNNGDNSNNNKTPKKLYQTQRKLLEYFLSEEKKDVLKNLEDVLLEPPRSAKGKSRAYLRKTKFLPDLLNDSLEGYSRRVYIDVGGGHGSTRWFEQNYPTRNKDFDLYRIETVPETETEVETDDAWEGPPTQMGISDWLWRNVKAEEYVVMKAEAEVVEEMLKSKAIVLVDELFLECKPWGKGGKSKRAYWECLALYGRLRDFGVAVHQWWG